MKEVAIFRLPVRSPLTHDAVAYARDWNAAYYHARRLGLSEADCEDCAMSYVLHLLVRDHAPSRDEALRRRYAHNFACDVSRFLQRRARHEVPADAEGDGPCTGPTPEQETMRRVFWDLLGLPLGALPPQSQAILLGHHCDGLTVRELAEVTGKTEKAVEQVLVRSLRRLRVLLAEAGVDVAELEGCLPRKE